MIYKVTVTFQKERGKWTILKHFWSHSQNQVFQYYLYSHIFLTRSKFFYTVKSCFKYFSPGKHGHFLSDFKWGQSLKSQETLQHLTFNLWRTQLWGLSKISFGSYALCKRIWHRKKMLISKNVRTLTWCSDDLLLSLQTKQDHSEGYCTFWQLYHHKWAA